MLASTLAVSGVAAAADSIDRDGLIAAAREYYSKADVRKAVRNHGEGLLVELANRGYLDDASVSALPISNLYSSVEDYGRASEGTIVFGVPGTDEPEAKIEIKKRSSDRAKLVVVVEPERGYSVAVIEDSSSRATGKTVVRSDGVSTLGCSWELLGEYCEVYCGPYSCGCLTTHYCRYDTCHTHDTCNSCDNPACE